MTVEWDCRQKLYWNVQNNWLSIIFSDETKIMLGRNGKVYVWRKPDCLGQLDDFETTCRASVKFWGWITYYGVGTLVAIDGNMNTDKYISVLDDNLWPVVVRHFSDRPRIFQEDNAPCHVSLRANQWKEENGIRTLLWPPQSPDLNIIENVWKVLIIQVQKRLIKECRWLETCCSGYLDRFARVCTTYGVYDSIPRGIRCVLRSRGQITKY